MGPRDTVLIVLPSLTLGGCETQGLFYAKAIASSGYGRPLFVSLGREGELVPLLKRQGFRFITLNSTPSQQSGRLNKLLFFVRFAVALRKTRPKAIIAQSYWPNLLTAVVWRFTGAKRFFWIQGSLDTTIDMTIWERFAMHMHPTYLANSEACRSFIMRRHGLKDVPGLIYNGLRFPDKVVRTPDGPLQLLMVANFFPEKDHATVLMAFVQLLKEFPDARLHFVGKGPGTALQMNEMKALACDLKLSGKVIFHGALRNVGPFLRLADIGILSTRSEGLSNSLLEYMAYGLPVVATAIAPNLEALGDENAPWMFTPGDVDALTALLLRLCRDSELRAQLGQHNRQEARSRFALPVFSERFIRELNRTEGAETAEAS